VNLSNIVNRSSERSGSKGTLPSLSFRSLVPQAGTAHSNCRHRTENQHSLLTPYADICSNPIVRDDVPAGQAVTLTITTPMANVRRPFLRVAPSH
jgi:hypothetical protein